MHIFAVDIGAADLYLTPAEYAAELYLKEGETFSLTSISVTSQITYKLIDGVPIEQALAFPELDNLPMEHK